MFGYIRPLSAELRVREYAYYRALYCGVCKHMEKNVSPLLSLTLRYDFVLLVMLRMILTGEHGNLRPMRCLANPWHKKTVLCDADALDYTSYASALLTHRGVLDNIADEHGIKRLLYRLVSPVTAGMRKKALKKMPALSPLDRTMEQQLAALCQKDIQFFFHRHSDPLSIRQNNHFISIKICLRINHIKQIFTF